MFNECTPDMNFNIKFKLKSQNVRNLLTMSNKSSDFAFYQAVAAAATVETK